MAEIIQFPEEKDCPICQGSGGIPIYVPGGPFKIRACRICKGKGRVPIDMEYFNSLLGKITK